MMLTSNMFERTRMKSVNDVVIGSVSEKKKERAVSPLLWKDVSLFDEESLVPRDLFQAKVQETTETRLWETKRSVKSPWTRNEGVSSETKDSRQSLSRQLLESERRWSSHLQEMLNEKSNQVKFLSEKLKLVSSRLHDARKRGYLPYVNTIYDDETKSPPGFNTIPPPLPVPSSFEHVEKKEENNDEIYNRCDIYVGDLPPDTTSDDIRDLFTHYGDIVEVHNTWGAFAFVVFESIESARDALNDVNVISLNGRVLKVSRCSSSPDRGNKKKSGDESTSSSLKTRSPKDWTCPECNQSVFKWRQKCFFCDTPRPNAEISRIYAYEDLSNQDKRNAKILAEMIRDRLYREDKEWLPIDHIGGWLSQVECELRNVVSKLGGFAAYLKIMNNVFEVSSWKPATDDSSPLYTSSSPSSGAPQQRWIRLTHSAKMDAAHRGSCEALVLRN